ncbi:UPF0755 protein [Virgibacillus halotolerans]|uniref:endolytic transglycosylase MltG n=1 Tax=Virgibacillus halotolerans TaxID=1071053 RepID=UPI0019603767|nr:endolytic transglycosylase MltG [Virgibacillus halotolerans]MBM7597861.1 UPF0755 protein [Virgibacillus halotolerans]
MSKKKKKETYRDNLNARSEEAKKVRKIVAIIILSLVVILLIGCIFGYTYIKSALNPVDPNSTEEITVDIPIGSSSSTIAKLLEENGLIKDARVFRFYTKFKNESNFQAGEYTFKPSMTLNEFIQSLKSGKVVAKPVYKVTIPEGKSIDEIAEIYAKELPFSKKEFLKQVNDPDYIKELMEEYPKILTKDILDKDIRTPLEGYLFAATYNFYEEEPSVKSVVMEMMDKTEEVLSDYTEDIEENDYSIHEIVTLASLVEKESGTKDQREQIAGVFYNRLDEGMKLQTDPTVLYALGEHKGKVLSKDLKTDSPYNTYQVDTLPVGPISNFAVSSLDAVLHPEDSDYIYFLHDDKGNIYFSETHEEHLKYKKKYIK